MTPENPTVFGAILRGELPCKKAAETPELFAFHDIAPKAPVHILIIPKAYIPSLDHTDDKALLGSMLLLAKKLALEHNLDGYKTVIHTGSGGGQEVFHLHVHLLGTPKK